MNQIVHCQAPTYLRLVALVGCRHFPLSSIWFPGKNMSSSDEFLLKPRRGNPNTYIYICIYICMYIICLYIYIYVSSFQQIANGGCGCLLWTRPSGYLAEGRCAHWGLVALRAMREMGCAPREWLGLDSRSSRFQSLE